MSRSGYVDEMADQWALIMWRGAVASAIRGRRGQKFLRELLAAFDALSEKRLIEGDLVREGDVCAIGAVGKLRGVPLESMDPDDCGAIAKAFGISEAMVREILFQNDDGVRETPEQRFVRMRRWVISQIAPTPAEKAPPR